MTVRAMRPGVVLCAAALLACSRGLAPDHAAPTPGRDDAGSAAGADDAGAPRPTPVVTDAASARSAPSVDASASPPPSLRARPVARELALAEGRSVYYALPDAPGPARLVGHLHGICFPTSYSAGAWLGAATAVGALVAPSGNARCGDSAKGPPSWEADTWEHLVAIMDVDLERAVARVESKHRGAVTRRGAVLTGWSRGAFAAPVIARSHPGRWPFLVLVEANVPLAKDALAKAGVRAVALVAGEKGTELAGETKTVATLTAAGFPAQLFVMPGTAHLYSDDIEDVMARALAFVLAHEADAPDAGP